MNLCGVFLLIRVERKIYDLRYPSCKLINKSYFDTLIIIPEIFPEYS